LRKVDTMFKNRKKLALNAETVRSLQENGC
jgi:hypothetical protein